MLTAHFKKQKIIVTLEREISNWELESDKLTYIVRQLKEELTKQFALEILQSIEYQVKAEFKDKIFKEIADSDFAMDVFKEKLREQLGKSFRF